MADATYTPDVQNLVDAWRPYVDSVEDWQMLVEGVEAKATGCGPVYELDNPLGRANESFAVADMRGVEFAQPTIILTAKWRFILCYTVWDE